MMAENDQLNAENSDDDCIRNRLLKLIECPVCYESMSSTEMCINGHTVCRRCRGQLRVCPLCSSAFGSVRNLLGEGVAELLACKRCCNSSRGCNQFLSEKECERHEECCSFRLYSCKECKDQLCFMELKDHFQNKHESNVLVPFVPRVLQTDEALTGRKYFSLIEFNNEFFWFWRKHDETDVYFGLQYCGEREKVSAYKYNFQLLSNSEKAGMEFTAPVLPDVKDINQYSENNDYVVISKNFMGEGAKIEVSIAKA